MKKILIANIFGIGDVLFTTPLVLNFKKNNDDIVVDYLCNARTRGILECQPGVNEIFVYEKDDLTRLWKESKTKCIKALWELFSRIRKKHYDAVFDFTLSREFGLFFTLAGIPRRIGLNYKKRGFFLTDEVPLIGFEGRHVVEHYLDLLKCVDIQITEKNMSLRPDGASGEWVTAWLKEKGIKEGDTLAAIVPGGGASWGREAARKRARPGIFSEAANALAEEGVKIVLLGDEHETDLCRSVARGMREWPAISENALTLKKYIALISRCKLVLCNDGGPLHIAVALGVRTVSIFGPVDPKVYGPYPESEMHKVIVNKRAECRPCYSRFKVPECAYDNKCLAEIEPETVSKVCLELIGR